MSDPQRDMAEKSMVETSTEVITTKISVEKMKDMK